MVKAIYDILPVVSLDVLPTPTTTCVISDTTHSIESYSSDFTNHLKQVGAYEYIDKAWKEISSERDNLYNSMLVRFDSIKHTDSQSIIFVSSDVTYKEVVGLRYLDKVRPREILPQHVFRVVSAYVICVTADDEIFLIGRDSGDWDKALEFSGGFIQDRYAIKNVADFAYQRIAEDLDVDRDLFHDAHCHGYLDYKEILELVLIYSVRSTYSFAELENIVKKPIYKIPQEYTVSNHDAFFDIQILDVMKHTLTHFIDLVRKTGGMRK